MLYLKMQLGNMYYRITLQPDFVPIPFPKALPRNLSKQQKTSVNCFKFDVSNVKISSAYCVSSVVGLCIMPSASVGLRPYPIPKGSASEVVKL
jgi:hypothetical protein